jgi:1-acyl-sn-glycerol-3-phosphate acyltransferase
MTGPLAKVRSAFGVLVALASFVPIATLQRLVLWPLLALAPSLRLPVMSRLMHFEAWAVLAGMEIGGARFRRTGTIPTGEPALVVMNHQSLLDIPTAVIMGRPFTPLFVTRSLYGRGIPMISLMLRLLRAPLVDPEADPRGALKKLKAAAIEERSALLIYPEGHRTRDGSVGEFKKAGVLVILRARRMPVYLVVSDGFWVWRRMADSFFEAGRVRGETEVLGPFLPPEGDGLLDAFVDEMRGRLVAHLQAMRDRRGVAAG